MTWPLIERELRNALRKRQLHQTLWWGTVGCVGVTFLFLLFSDGNARWGKGLNQLLFWGGLFIVSQVPSYTVGIFAEERRNQTLGLLFLCGINSTELFVSKTLGSVFVSLNQLILLYPFLAIAFLSGGLSIDQFLATAISLPVLLLFVISVCVLASVLCEEESTAMFVAILFGAAVCAIAPLVNLLAGLGPASNELLVLSPAWPAYLALKQLSVGTITEFWKASLISILWSALILFTAGFVLGRVWQDNPDSLPHGSPRARLRESLHGNAIWRRRLFERWQDVNPFVWLAMRDRWLVTLAWIVVGALMLAWMLSCLFWPQTWICPLSMFVTAILLNYSLQWLSVFAAVGTIGHNRRSGGLELLLTTPLDHRDVIRGQLVALREQFRPVALGVLGFEIILLTAGIATRSWTTPSLVVYLIIWSVLLGCTISFSGSFRNALFVFWDSLVCGRPAYVALKTSGLTPSPTWALYFFFIGGNAFRGFSAGGMKAFPTGSLPELVLCGVGLIVLIWTRSLRKTNLQSIERRLALDLRAIAAQPVPEPSDPGYKHWKSGEHFPEMFQQSQKQTPTGNSFTATNR